jgi:alkylhydroperoxidase family enzyme
MPRISYIDTETITDPEIQAILDRAAQFGTPRPESQAIRAHNPAVMKAFDRAWETFFRQGEVDHAIKELCRLYISKSVACEYCGGQRSVTATRQGMGEAKVDEILNFEASDRFDERERAALRWAMAIAWDASIADDALWNELHTHFSELQLVELGHFIALTLGQQRFIKTLDLKHGEVLPGAAGLAPELVAEHRRQAAEPPRVA